MFSSHQMFEGTALMIAFEFRNNVVGQALSFGSERPFLDLCLSFVKIHVRQVGSGGS